MSVKVSIESFNGTNFPAWKFRMKCLLAEHDCSANIETKIRNKGGKKFDEKELRKDAKAKNLIVQNVADSHLSLLQNCDCAYEMWKILTDQFEKKGMCGKIMIKKKLMNMKMNNDESVQDYSQRFDTVVSELKSLEEEVKDSEILCQYLIGINEKYSTLVSIIENMKEEDLSLDYVKRRLLNEEEKLMIAQSVPNHKVDKNMVFQADSGRGPVCFKCGKLGHFQKRCFQNQNYRGNNHGYSNNRSGSYSHNRGGGYSNNRGGSYANNRGGSYTNNRGGYPNRGDYHNRGGFQGRFRGTSNRGGHYENSNYVSRQENDSETRNDQAVCFNSEHEQQEYQSVSDTELKLFLDSGCTDHIVSNIEYFETYLPLKEPIPISIAKEGMIMNAVGIGTIKGIIICDNERIPCILKNVLHVPNGRRNLLSVKKMEMTNFKILFAHGEAKVYSPYDRLVARCKLRNLYEFTMFVDKKDTSCNITECELWHKRFGHLNYFSLQELQKKNMVDGMCKIDPSGISDICEACMKGKMHRTPFGSRKCAKSPLEIVHSDVCGPINPVSTEGYRYYVSFMDDYTHFTVVYCLKTKDEVFSKFKEYYQLTKSKFNRTIHKLRVDNGGEYCGKVFQQYCAENGIVLDYTMPYSPQQNMKAERLNRSIMEKARAMIADCGADKSLWSEAVYAAVYTLNRSPTSCLENITPAEVWYGDKPNVKNLRVFGCSVYYHVPKEKRQKLDDKCRKGVFIGYFLSGYRIYDIETKNVILSRDVKFDESKFPFKLNTVENYNHNDYDVEENTVLDDCESIQNSSTANMDNERNDSVGNEINNSVENVSLEPNHSQGRLTSKRQVKLPSKLVDYEMYMALCGINFVDNIPNSYDEALSGDNSSQWAKSMERELKSIETNETWEIVEKPVGKQILETKWVYAKKEKEEGEERFKARLVVRGFAQNQESINFDEIYSPVAKLTTIRTLLAVGLEKDFYFQQLDVKTAFLNGEIDSEIYLYPPQGLDIRENSVLRLNKALYGLKQASYCWNKRFDKTLKNLNFTRSENDYCLYSSNVKGQMLYLIVYVDDIILASASLDLINMVKKQLFNEFQIKDKGELKYFLGLEINHDRMKGIMTIKQTDYARKILERFGMSDCKPSNIPIDPRFDCNGKSNTSSDVNRPYRELIGALMFLMLGSRPDLSYSINYFSRFQSNYSDELWQGLKRILRYVKGTIDEGLVYKKTCSNFVLTSYVDSDWASNSHDRKSVSGYLFKINNNIVGWHTKKQNCVTLSTTEAELVAFCISITEGLWLRKILSDLDCKIDNLCIFEDNQGCINILKNPENNKRVKHIDVKYMYICEKIKSQDIIVKYIDTKFQQADILTKGLDRITFYRQKEMLSISS